MGVLQVRKPNGRMPPQIVAPSVSWLTRWRLRFAALRLRRGALREDVYRLARWLRYEVVAEADAEASESTTVDVVLTEAGQVAGLTRSGTVLEAGEAGACAGVWRFLASLGVRRCHLDARLDRDQLMETVVFLWALRAAVAARRMSGPGRSALAALYTEPGVHIACTEVSLRGAELRVRSSYCTTQFDHIVDWFERGPRTLRDHRTYFRAAGLYAGMAVMLVTGPSLFYASIHALWYEAILLGLASVVLFGLVYVAMMVIGRVEYDNEEKTEQLARALQDLHRYTDRIGTDLDRARQVQEKFLPRPERMPHQQHIRWASRFEPAERVGGDYFDVAAVDEDRVVILFSDVCGHGMSAAFLTAVLKSTFLGWLDHHTGLDTLANELNSHLVRLAPSGSFAAVFLALYDTRCGRLEYANCGHQPEPWLCPAEAKETVRPLSNARNLLLGIEPRLALQIRSLYLKPGDTLLFVSDGVVESAGEDDPYRTGELTAFLGQRRAAEVGRLVDEIRAWADGPRAAPARLDDRAILGLQVRALACERPTVDQMAADAYVI
ncbi:MAG TPA: serine/threonine-protein phosphatase [Phycisphaerales bacterium]|nr:serine/threonine-protein phosphatase [Phycisphaerales bacterium]